MFKSYWRRHGIFAIDISNALQTYKHHHLRHWRLDIVYTHIYPSWKWKKKNRKKNFSNNSNSHNNNPYFPKPTNAYSRLLTISLFSSHRHTIAPKTSRCMCRFVYVDFLANQKANDPYEMTLFGCNGMYFACFWMQAIKFYIFQQKMPSVEWNKMKKKRRKITNIISDVFDRNAAANLFLAIAAFSQAFQTVWR